MPPQKSTIVDPTDILLSIFNEIDPVRVELQATIAEAEREFAGVNAVRAEELAAERARAAAGEDIDWRQFFRDHPLVYSHDLQKLRRQLADTEGGWVTYSLSLFSGRDDLTESERQVWRRTIRELEADGFLERFRREVRLTPDGLAHLREQLAAHLAELEDSDDSTT